MITEPRAQCSLCRKRTTVTDLLAVRRTGGGTYRRASRSYRTRICVACATKVVADATPGHHVSDRYSLSSIRAALASRTSRLTPP